MVPSVSYARPYRRGNSERLRGQNKGYETQRGRGHELRGPLQHSRHPHDSRFQGRPGRRTNRRRRPQGPDRQSSRPPRRLSKVFSKLRACTVTAAHAFSLVQPVRQFLRLRFTLFRWNSVVVWHELTFASVSSRFASCRRRSPPGKRRPPPRLQSWRSRETNSIRHSKLCPPAVWLLASNLAAML